MEAPDGQILRLRLRAQSVCARLPADLLLGLLHPVGERERPFSTLASHSRRPKAGPAEQRKGQINPPMIVFSQLFRVPSFFFVPVRKQMKQKRSQCISAAWSTTNQNNGTCNKKANFLFSFFSLALSCARGALASSLSVFSLLSMYFIRVFCKLYLGGDVTRHIWGREAVTLPTLAFSPMSSSSFPPSLSLCSYALC